MKYHNHLNTGLVWYLMNGRFVSGCQKVWCLNVVMETGLKKGPSVLASIIEIVEGQNIFFKEVLTLKIKNNLFGKFGHISFIIFIEQFSVENIIQDQDLGVNKTTGS